MKTKTASGIMLTLLSLLPGLIGNFAPQVNASLTGNDFVTEVSGWTDAGFNAVTVAIDSSDRIFVGSDNDVFRSTDNGATWTQVLNASDTVNMPRLLFVDSNDYVYAQLWDSGANYDLYRSIDNGDSWSVIENDMPMAWHMDEATNGSLYFNTYSSPALGDFIYKSDDSGASFSQWFNVTEQLSIKHVHVVAVDDNNSSRVWLATGDATAEQSLMYFNGSGWTTIETGLTFTSLWFDSDYVYAGADGHYLHYRIPLSNPIWSARESFFDLGVHRDTTNFAFDGAKIGDIMVFGTEDGQVWASWDGLRWVKFADFGDSASVFRFTRARPIYVTEKTAGKLYRLDVTKEDVIKVFYEKYNSLKGSETNANTFVLEQRLTNDTNYVDLTDVALSDVSASIKGLSKSNFALVSDKIANSGFEWNNSTGWEVLNGSGTYGIGRIVSSESANGTYSLEYEKDAGDSQNGFFRPRDGALTTFSMNRGDIILASAYVKGNVSSSDRMIILFYNATAGTPEKSVTFDLTTSWTRITAFYTLNDADSETIRVAFQSDNGIDFLSYWDSILVQKLEVGIAYETGSDTSDALQWAENYEATSFFTTDQDTQNPTLTVGGQAVSHSGTLTNGTESSTINLTGVLTGAVQVIANIQGSGQAILRITGTRIVSLTNTVLKQRTSDGIYVGRYFATPTLTTNVTDFIALTNKEANITSTSYMPNKLNLTVNSLSGTTSTTLIYIGDKGEPKEVNGATSWSYDEPSKLLTITVTHTDPATIITLKWRLPGDANGDGTVDIFDIGTISAHWYPGPPIGPLGYDPSADLNNDGAVDIFDIGIVSANWGQTW